MGDFWRGANNGFLELVFIESRTLLDFNHR
jgi:hypothetical protein